MILESKEQLMKQLQEAWSLLIKVDAALEDAVDLVVNMRKDVRDMIRQHDKTTVRGADGVDTTRYVGTRPSTQGTQVPGLPNAGPEQVHGSRRGTPQ